MKGNVCTGLYYHDEKKKMIYDLHWSQYSKWPLVYVIYRRCVWIFFLDAVALVQHAQLDSVHYAYFRSYLLYIILKLLLHGLPDHAEQSIVMP